MNVLNQYGYITCDDKTVTEAIFQNIKSVINEKATIKSYIAKEVLNNVNSFIEQMKKKNEEKDDLTATEHFLVSSPFDIVVKHFVKNNIGGKVYIENKLLDTTLSELDKLEVTNSLLVKKRNGQLGLRVRSPDKKIFLKNITVNNNVVYDENNNKIYKLKNSIIMKILNEKEEDNPLFKIFSENSIFFGKIKNIEGIIYKKSNNEFLEYLSYGGVHDGLLKAKMTSTGQMFLNKFDEKLQEIISISDPIIKNDVNRKIKP